MSNINKKNAKMDFQIQIERQYPAPIDSKEIWYDLEQLKAYALSGATSYAGQTVKFINEAENNKIYVYTIEADGTLKETGADVKHTHSADDIEETETKKFVSSELLEKIEQVSTDVNQIKLGEGIKSISSEIVIQNEEHNFVTQTQISTWDSKIDSNGNVSTATKLQNPVNINGIPFDGSKDITIPSSSNFIFKVEDGHLILYTTDGVTSNPTFTLEDGHLIMEIN